MVHPVGRVFLAGGLASVVMIGAVLVHSSPEQPAQQRPDSASSASSTPIDAPAGIPASEVDAPPPAPATVNATEAPPGASDEEINALLDSHPELRASIEELLNDPDPVVRKESAALILELAAATAETTRAR